MGLRDKILGKAPQPKKAEVAPPKPKHDPTQLSLQEIEILLKLLGETTFQGKDVATIWSITSKLNDQINKII